MVGVDLLEFSTLGRDASGAALSERQAVDPGAPAGAEHLAILAVLLGEASGIYASIGDDLRAGECRCSAFALAVEVFRGDLPVPREITAVLAPIVVEPCDPEAGTPPDVLRRVITLSEESGDYAQAENHLFYLLDEAPDSPETRALGIAFYERLLLLDDAALIEGGLTREEVVAGSALLHGSACGS